jgi:hypothetical protein
MNNMNDELVKAENLSQKFAEFFDSKIKDIVK